MYARIYVEGVFSSSYDCRAYNYPGVIFDLVLTYKMLPFCRYKQFLS